VQRNGSLAVLCCHLATVILLMTEQQRRLLPQKPVLNGREISPFHFHHFACERSTGCVSASRTVVSGGTLLSVKRNFHRRGANKGAPTGKASAAPIEVNVFTSVARLGIFPP
jgi:hypothetical protein